MKGGAAGETGEFDESGLPGGRDGDGGVTVGALEEGPGLGIVGLDEIAAGLADELSWHMRTPVEFKSRLAGSVPATASGRRIRKGGRAVKLSEMRRE